MTETNIVAWWGAIIATLVLIWDIAKWYQDGPKIKHRLKLNTGYLDGEVLSSEITEAGKKQVLADYCHIELINTGNVATTIMRIEATHDSCRDIRIVSTVERFKPHFGKALPIVLSPGEVWSCRLRMEDLYRLAERGSPQIQVTISSKDNPLVIKPKMPRKASAKSEA